MNHAHLIGRVTKNPEVRYTDSGMAVASFTLAVDRRNKEKDTDFIQCKAFNKTAETIGKYVQKGTKIAVNGRIQTGSYTNRDGAKVYTTDVIVNEFEFCESKNASASDSNDSNLKYTRKNAFDDMDEDDSDLPF